MDGVLAAVFTDGWNLRKEEEEAGSGRGEGCVTRGAGGREEGIDYPERSLSSFQVKMCIHLEHRRRMR